MAFTRAAADGLHWPSAFPPGDDWSALSPVPGHGSDGNGRSWMSRPIMGHFKSGVLLSEGSKAAVKSPTRRRRERKTGLACLPCQKSHYPCNEERPCGMCVKRGRAESCVDGLRKRAKYLDVTDAKEDASETHGPSLLPQQQRDHQSPLLGRDSSTKDNVHAPDPRFCFLDEHYQEVKPFNYAASYAKMLRILALKLTDEGMHRVLRALSSIHPTAMFQLQSLTDNDLLFREYSIIRSLSELSRTLPATAAPYCIFRRTGEILAITAEFAFLTRWHSEQLRGRRVFETVWEERGAVGFWEGMAVCVGDWTATARGFRLDAGLCRPDGTVIPGAWWITVRRDIFDMPLLIVGCFLPHLWSVP